MLEPLLHTVLPKLDQDGCKSQAKGRSRHSDRQGGFLRTAVREYEFTPPRTAIAKGVPTLDPGQQLRATMGYGCRNPSLRELWFEMPIGLATVVENPDLDPEKMRSFEVGQQRTYSPSGITPTSFVTSGAIAMAGVELFW